MTEGLGGSEPREVASISSTSGWASELVAESEGWSSAWGQTQLALQPWTQGHRLSPWVAGLEQGSGAVLLVGGLAVGI